MDIVMNEIFKHQPKLNSIIKRGMARDVLQNIMEEYHVMLDSMINKHNGNNGLFKYVGYRALYPSEEVDSILTPTQKSGGQRKNVDISPTDARKYRAHFIYNGVSYYKDIYMIAVNDMSSIRISNTKYYLAPVLANPIISPTNDGQGLFLNPFKIKSIAKSRPFLVSYNDRVVDGAPVYIEKFYNSKRIDDKINPVYKNIECPLIFYTLCRYTIEELVKREKYDYGKDFLIIDRKDVKLKKIDLTKYDIVKSLGKHHPDVSKRVELPKNNIIILINKDIKNNRFLLELAFNLMYAFDAYPDMAEAVVNSIGLNSELPMWKLFTGAMTFKEAYTRERIIEAIDEHLNRIENYLEPLSIKRFAQMGIKVETMHDLIIALTKEFKDRLSTSREYDNQQQFKERHLEIVYYVLFNLITTLNIEFDNLLTTAKKNRLTDKNINQYLNKLMPTRAILNISKSSSQILPLMLFNTVPDNGSFKIYPTLEIQERGDGVSRAKAKRGKAFPENVRKLTGMSMFIGSLYYQPKACPTPLVRLNPMSQWDEEYQPLLSKSMDTKVNRLNKLLSNTFEDISFEEDIDTIKDDDL